MRCDGEGIGTKRIILTLDKSALPQAINAAFIRCQVRPYILNLPRCCKCQRHRHATHTYRGRLTCGKCAQHRHPTRNCTSNAFKCLNCENSLSACPWSCDIFKNEKKLLKTSLYRSMQKARYVFVRSINWRSLPESSVLSQQRSSTAAQTLFRPHAPPGLPKAAQDVALLADNHQW